MTACGVSPENEICTLGQYPGDPAENYAPQLSTGGGEYRNLALNRSAIASSSIDFNLTGQLATDGITTTGMPSFLRLYAQGNEVPRKWRERLFDENHVTTYLVEGGHAELVLDVSEQAIDIDRMIIGGQVNGKAGSGDIVRISGSDDGQEWTLLYEKKGNIQIGAAPEDHPGKTIRNWFSMEAGLPKAVHFRKYKMELNADGIDEWYLASLNFYLGEKLQRLLPSHSFTSAWVPETGGQEELTIDLGAESSLSCVKLFWINPAKAGKLLVSQDGKDWKEAAALDGEAGAEQSIDIKGKGRFVRLALEESANGLPYILSEMEVWGKGGVIYSPAHEDAVTAGLQNLDGGDWTLARASEVPESGEAIASKAFKAEGWIPATVPGTILTSYKNIGAVPDPNPGYNQLQISESYFLSDFWYRRSFNVSDLSRISQLCFDGINWKADIWLNGEKLGRIEGAFKQGVFDVSGKLVKGENVLAVLIHKNDHPGIVKERTAWTTDLNGGILGADNPTFHASIGWDWIPTIRGRNCGIWNDVYIKYTDAVSIHEPFIQAHLNLPDTTKAEISFQALLKNHTDKAVSGVLEGNYGDSPARFSIPVELGASEEKLVSVSSSDFPQLALANPKLWWPVGYGEQNLYKAVMEFKIDGKVSDSFSVMSGVREMTYNIENYVHEGGNPRPTERPERLNIYINGQRFVGFGGNWGFSESNLNYRAREYDAAVRYHADMHFTMIRNWVGQIGDDEFYEACDKYGVMVWQDFWLANPWDGPNPDNNAMFMDNAEDMLKRTRNHASIAIYVGRNEGYPPEILDNALRAKIAEVHPGIYYISDSAADAVSGEGPYRALPPVEYFRNYGHDKFHSERGMPNAMTYESMKLAFGDDIEPYSSAEHPNAVYGTHDYGLSNGPGPAGTATSAQATETFNELMRNALGEPADARQYAEWAQWVNYDGYRAMFEGRSQHRQGLLLWMTHPAWPSMAFQSYDYYLNPSAAYFACRKACEPLHIQYNPLDKDIEVVNYHSGDRSGLSARAYIYAQDGTLMWQEDTSLDSNDDSTVKCFPVTVPEGISPTYFLRLYLSDAEGNELSHNDYCLGVEDGNFQSLQGIKHDVSASTSSADKDGLRIFTTTIRNNGSAPAPMIRLQAASVKGGFPVAPAIYSDNYFLLLGGEELTVTTEVALSDIPAGGAEIKVSGYNW